MLPALLLLSSIWSSNYLQDTFSDNLQEENPKRLILRWHLYHRARKHARLYLVMDSSISAMNHAPAQEYSLSMPSPPRVTIPPPRLTPDGLPMLQLVSDTKGDYESSGFSNAEFLNMVTHGNLITRNNMVEWRYEQRRAAQKITPFLYLGPVTAAKDKDFLINEGISMVMSVRNIQYVQANFLGSRVAHELGLEVLSIDVNGNQELIAAFPRGIEAINGHLSKMYQLQKERLALSGEKDASVPGKVLLFCESGNERSATMVAAYIMAMYSKDVTTTLQIVQAQRFCVALNDSLRDLLRTYDTILKAKRDTHKSLEAERRTQHSVNGFAENSPNQAALRVKNAKRAFDDFQQDDLDFDMEGDHGQKDAERFEARDGLAPFYN